jgi:GntR family transcriptional regulator, transcriptional repressor for pyruvate dehydrogenase complex
LPVCGCKLYDDQITMSIAVFTPSSPKIGPEKLQTARLSDRLAALIEAQIDGGSLITGARLPTEQQLASAHGVSRTVVREAVHQLKSQGLVRSRQGSGVFVTDPPAHRALAFDPMLLESMDAVVQMVELRRVIEGEMTALAATRATRAQQAALKRALLAIDAATERGELGAYLRDAMTVTKGYESKRTDFMAQVRREHRAIVDAVVAGNAKAARAAAIEHHLNGERRLIVSGVIKPSRVRSRR